MQIANFPFHDYSEHQVFLMELTSNNKMNLDTNIVHSLYVGHLSNLTFIMYDNYDSFSLFAQCFSHNFDKCSITIIFKEKPLKFSFLHTHVYNIH